MSHNTDLLQSSLDKITPRLLEEAIFLAFYNGVETVAPLGFSGQTIRLHGGPRQSEVSVRNHSGTPEMLVTDRAGHFLCLLKMHMGLGIATVAAHFYTAFEWVCPLVEDFAPKADPITRPSL